MTPNFITNNAKPKIITRDYPQIPLKKLHERLLNKDNHYKPHYKPPKNQQFTLCNDSIDYKNSSKTNFLQKVKTPSPKEFFSVVQRIDLSDPNTHYSNNQMTYNDLVQIDDQNSSPDGEWIKKKTKHKQKLNANSFPETYIQQQPKGQIACAEALRQKHVPNYV
jgi:hypothetical protein